MKRIKGNECGLINFQCVKPVFRSYSSIKLIADDTNYTYRNIQRQKHDNFYNLPQTFQGIIPYTPFIDFNKTLRVRPSCTRSQNAVQRGNFIYHTLVQKNQNYKNVWYKGRTDGNGHPLMDSYVYDTEQKPGIILPINALDFQQLQQLTDLPVTQSPMKTSPTYNIPLLRDIKSSCPKGFNVSIQKYDDRLDITLGAGSVILGLSKKGLIQVKSINKIKKTVELNDGDFVLYILIYILSYRQKDQRKLQVYFDFNQTFQQHIRTKVRPQYALISAVRWDNQVKTADISTMQCSPVSLIQYLTQFDLFQTSDSSSSFFDQPQSSDISSGESSDDVESSDDIESSDDPGGEQPPEESSQPDIGESSGGPGGGGPGGGWPPEESSQPQFQSSQPQFQSSQPDLGESSDGPDIGDSSGGPGIGESSGGPGDQESSNGGPGDDQESIPHFVTQLSIQLNNVPFYGTKPEEGADTGWVRVVKYIKFKCYRDSNELPFADTLGSSRIAYQSSDTDLTFYLTSLICNSVHFDDVKTDASGNQIWTLIGYDIDYWFRLVAYDKEGKQYGIASFDSDHFCIAIENEDLTPYINTLPCSCTFQSHKEANKAAIEEAGFKSWEGISIQCL